MFNKKAIEELKESTDLKFSEINNTLMQISEKQNTFEQIQNATGKKTPSKWDSDKLSDHDKLMAAYALNLCTVSVSQIIDYNDLNILEQEYDAILNNLNLENIPDDDALLKILKQILDTITFFRIQEGDKKFIDQEYQQKMKNAIWSAVPNFGVIVAGGLNPWSIGIALASQVGIGYMNYRKQKAQNKLEYEKQEWQLQRSAMEQFNALQRELFDTAWRLAKKYKFDDALRLTENQIKQFNDILMDTDIFRKYERLVAINKNPQSSHDNFDAYPPYWYHLGNAANAIAQEYSIEGIQGNEDDIRFQRKKKIYDDYKALAKSHFEEFLKLKDFPLLREDKIVASCCLEYIDLLDGNTQKDKINELLDLAIANSGTQNDIKQICAMDYLRIGNYEKAMEYLRILVTENYNATTNAQLLSQLYVSKAIEEKSDNYLQKYETLSRFVNRDVLLPYPERFPKSVEEEKQINREFLDIQRKILARKFGQILENLVNKYFIQLNRKIENPSPFTEYKDSYFIVNNKKRDEDFKNIFAGGSKQNQKNDYLNRLKDYNISVEYVETLNEYLQAIQKITGINAELTEPVEESVMVSKNKIQSLQDKIDNDSFEYVDYLQLDELFKSFISQSLINLYESFISYITTFETFSEIISTESNLHDLCVSEKIEEPDTQVFENTASPIVEDSGILDVGVLLGDETKNAKEKKAHIQTQLAVCKDYEQIALNEKFIKSNKVGFFTKGTPEYSKYFADNKKKLSDTLRQIYDSKQIIAVLDDKSFFSNIDLFFTPDKLFISSKNTYGGEVFYSEIDFSDDSLNYKNQNGKPCVYSNEYVVMEKLKELISNLVRGENRAFVPQLLDNEKSTADVGKSIALSVASYSLGFVPGLIMTTYQAADKIRKNEITTKKKRPKNDNGKYGFSEKEMRIIGYKTNYFLSWKTNEDARLEYETNPEAFKKHFGFEPKSGKCFASNNVSQNEIHEKYKNDEKGAYDFSDKELIIIGFITNDKLTDETFEYARRLYEESPELFKERYGFEPESGKWFEE